MSPGVEELPTGQQPRRRHSRRVRKVDFGQLDGLSTSADQELRQAEDALVAFMEQQAKRDALYVAGHIQSIKIAYDGAVKTIEDPAARITELTSKFGSLQQ